MLPWWRHQMETFSALLALCAGNSAVNGEFPTQRPVTWSFDVFFDLRVNKRLSKQSWGWWFETPESSLWRHCNDSCRKRLCDGFYEKWAQFLHMVIPVPFVMTVVISYDYPCPCNVRITYSFGLRKYKQYRCYCSYFHKPSELVILILQGSVTGWHAKVQCNVTKHLILKSYWPCFLWPLLLTWFNFNPSMDK